MDTNATGRVLLKKFYGKVLEGSYPFTESIEYLRRIGALDESSRSSGPSVIIPNYITSTNNCIMSGTYFSICCLNECAGLKGEIESFIGAPTAEPDLILAFVKNMSSSTVEAPRNLSSSLTSALMYIAEVNGGEVSLHGRLFAQWLHYAFPHECPYPHPLASGVSEMTPTQFEAQTGFATFVSKEDFVSHMKSSSRLPADHMSLWAHDDEHHISMPRYDVLSTRHVAVRMIHSVIIAVVFLVLWFGVSHAIRWLGWPQKSHDHFMLV